jgi:Cu(I)/Ag(I) efflux system membrane protein CusA/SilA
MLVYLRLAYDDWKKKGQLTSTAGLRAAIYHGAVKRVRPKAMTAAVIIAGLLPILWRNGAGADIMKRIATPMVAGIVTPTIMELMIDPAIFSVWRRRSLPPPFATPSGPTLPTRNRCHRVNELQIAVDRTGSTSA